MGSEGDLVLKLHGAEMQELPGKVAVVTLHTSRGDIQAILHLSETGRAAVIWAGGVNSDMNGPAGGLFADLASELAPQGVASLRIRYRSPSRFYECVLDMLAGISFLRGMGGEDIVLVGHGAGGAVGIMAGVLTESIRGVAALASDSYGAHLVHQLAPRPLLLVHGDRDHICPPENSEMVYHEAREPKHLVRYHDAGHSLIERRDDLAALLSEWVTDCLGGGPRRALTSPRARVFPLIADAGGAPTVKELVLFQGDITTVDVDAIVCPNNDRLWAADGVTGEILRKGGESVLRDAVAQGPAPLGSCVVTEAGDLPCARVLHAITFSAANPSPASEQVVLQATLACLQAAESLGLTSIAFPALGSGGAAMAFEASAAVVLPAVLDHLRKSPSLAKAVFALTGPGAFQTFAARLEALQR